MRAHTHIDRARNHGSFQDDREYGAQRRSTCLARPLSEKTEVQPKPEVEMKSRGSKHGGIASMWNRFESLLRTSRSAAHRVIIFLCQQFQDHPMWTTYIVSLPFEGRSTCAGVCIGDLFSIGRGAFNPLGGLNLYGILGLLPRRGHSEILRPFVCQKFSWGWGGHQISTAFGGGYRLGFHAQIFFLAEEI